MYRHLRGILLLNTIFANVFVSSEISKWSCDDQSRSGNFRQRRLHEMQRTPHEAFFVFRHSRGLFVHKLVSRVQSSNKNVCTRYFSEKFNCQLKASEKRRE